MTKKEMEQALEKWKNNDFAMLCCDLFFDDFERDSTMEAISSLEQIYLERIRTLETFELAHHVSIGRLK